MTKASIVHAETRLTNITQIMRPEIGPVYRSVISIATLHQLLKKAVVRYAPKYQRGFRLKADDLPEDNYGVLLPLNSDNLALDTRRAEAMAVKYLQRRLFTSHVTWNVRIDTEEDLPHYDEDKSMLTITSEITVPDTGHRHLAYFTLAQWHADQNKVPDVVVVDQVPVPREDFIDFLDDFDPRTEHIYVEIYCLTEENEGRLFDEFNSDAKPPATAIALDLNPTKTPSRRFVYELMEASDIFAREEIECRRNTIGSKSRKLVTNATLEAAVRPMAKDLAVLEKDRSAYQDLRGFTSAFFEEWAAHFPAWLPGASADDRNKLRDDSLALSNIMMHPLFRIVFRLWQEYHDSGTDWHNDKKWRSVIAKISRVMDRTNEEWQGRILVQVLDKEGKPAWSLSSTRQTREAAYQYLCDVGGIKEQPRRALAIAQ
jgi:DNA-sulfur modification-associated